ncbi:hypothetical protein F0562_027098 [Nyssa sinensis]|uniref:Uncharacterized protein n=1 Tax=Nyssa sinensis TaxID=561372 RepID=A0A5J5B4F6_9ASTE|nr:hypothetical protein F0562_027098 [Nyssa sinensis]
MDASASCIVSQIEENVAAGSIALVLESKLDKSTRIGGWLEMKRSNLRFLQWAVNMSDTPEDDFGWGLSLGGSIRGPRSWDHFQPLYFGLLGLCDDNHFSAVVARLLGMELLVTAGKYSAPIFAQ